jgi:uncharacterized membrane protein YjfL (UPF0719 family)
MNGLLILQGGIEIVLSLVTGFFVFFLSMKIFMLLTREINETEELKKNNTAVAVVLAAFVLALVLIVNSSVSPAMDTLNKLFAQESPAVGVILLDLLRIVIIYLAAMLIAIIVLWLSMSLYTGLTTKIDEMAELKKNNLAIGLVFAVFIFSAGFLALEPVSTILRSFVPPPPSVAAETVQEFVNTSVLLQGLVELPLAFIGTIVVFLLGVKLSDLMTGTIDELKELKKNNVASAIYTTSTLWSLMYLIKEAALKPLYPVLGRLIANREDTGQILLTVILIPVFFVVTGVITLLLTRLAQGVFMMLTTKIDEMAELKKNNVAVALILAALTISVVILVTHGMNVLAQGFVPSPQAAGGGGLPMLRIK